MASIKDVFKIDKERVNKVRQNLLLRVKEGYLPIVPMAQEMGIHGATLTAFLCGRNPDFKTLHKMEDWLDKKEKEEVAEAK